jgi:hypothetical protein
VKPQAQIKIAEKIHWKIVKGEAVLLDLQSGNYFTLDEVGTFLWQKIEQGSVFLSDLLAQLMEQYQCKATEAECDLLEFLNLLLSERLVQIKD